MKIIPEVSSFIRQNAKRNATPKSSMHSLELVVTIVLCFLLGRFLDSWLETFPVFTIVLGLFGCVGSFTSAYYRYQYTSKKEEEGKVWTRTTTKQTVDVLQDTEEGLTVPQGYGARDE